MRIVIEATPYTNGDVLAVLDAIRAQITEGERKGEGQANGAPYRWTTD